MSNDASNVNRFKAGTSSLKTDAALSSDNTSPVEINVNSFLDEMFPEEPKQPKGKNVNFYLSTEVINAIDNFANNRGISKSKLVDTILSHVLLQK